MIINTVRDLDVNKVALKTDPHSVYERKAVHI